MAASRLRSDGAPHSQIPQSMPRLTTEFLAALRVLRIKAEASDAGRNPLARKGILVALF